MPDLAYLNFDLEIRSRPGDGKYRAVTSYADGGLATTDFTQPFSDEDIETFRGVLGGPARDLQTPDGDGPDLTFERTQRVQRFGRRLFDAVFAPEVGNAFSGWWDRTRKQGAGLRIRLMLEDAPDLSDLPWEYLFRQKTGDYLVLAEASPIVRHFPLHSARVALQTKPPLNILVMVCNPKGAAQLQVQEELSRIEVALDPLIKLGDVTVDKIPNLMHKSATRAALLQQVKHGGKEYHVFHFIGHGHFDDKKGDAGLLLEGGPGGKGELVKEDLLKVLLDHETLRLAVLNSCEGARSSRWDAYSGVAQSLLRSKIPAVIAMQFKITDDAAITFASNFYQALASGRTVDASLAVARQAIYSDHNPTEWGTPVLFMESGDGRLFNIQRPTEEQVRRAKIEALSNDAKAEIDRHNWQKAIKRLEEIIAEEK